MSTSFPPAYPLSSSELTQIKAPAEVTMNSVSGGDGAPLDFLLVTSRIDFRATCRRFLDDSKRAGLNVDIIYIDDPAAGHNGDRLDHLLKQNAKWQSEGKINSSTIKLLLLHGGTAEPMADPGLNEFRQRYLRRDDKSLSPAPKEGEIASRDSRVHVMTAAADTMIFPTELIDAALRTLGADGQHGPAGFFGTIIFGSCESGVYRQAAINTGGDYVFGIGKKSGYLDDFEAGLSAILSRAADRKHQGSAPLSGRECWMLLRNISGEHVSFVGDSKLEITKSLQSGHSEPMLIGAGSSINTQAIRILFAKIKHGSAVSVRKVIDRWGPEILSADHAAVMPRLSLWSEAFASPRDGEQKIRLLMDQLPGFIMNEVMVLKCMKGCVEKKWTAILVDLFEKLEKHVPPPLSMENLVFSMKAAPDIASGLEKICKGSRQLSDAVGRYLLKAMEHDEKNSAHRLYVSPPFLQSLANRMHKKAQKTPQQ